MQEAHLNHTNALPWVFIGNISWGLKAGSCDRSIISLYFDSIKDPPVPFGAMPTASIARIKQIGKQSYSPKKSISRTLTCASSYAI